MIQDQTLRTVCHALHDQAAVDFVRASVKAGYREFFTATASQADGMVDQAFSQLALSQRDSDDPQKLVETTSALLADVFRKGDGSFWFNQGYHHYKTQIKPETDFQQLSELISGKRVLDYGCGSGYLAARLARGGYTVFTTDVLDYRYAEARHLPFVQMASPTDIPYPDDSIDTALVQAVLHHIDPGDLPRVIQRLAKVARRVVIKEDTYDLPRHLAGLSEVVAAQPLLKSFMALSPATQFQALVLIDFYANAVAQGLPEMNMPFGFRPVTEWERVLLSNGLRVSRIQVAGFEPGRMHKSCHVWLVCERAA